MKAKRTFSRRGMVFREGEHIPETLYSPEVMGMLEAEGWIERELEDVAKEKPVMAAKPARKTSKK
ncbi:MAG TPA: hypothetical protein PK040_02100 [Anaerolineaceae bacterium]|nr:hypothetical protein [Anaerolineaceae bacterium]